MSIKCGSIIVVILALFIAKISIENFGQAQAQTNEIRVTNLR